jgi:hypothetical protein
MEVTLVLVWAAWPACSAERTNFEAEQHISHKAGGCKMYKAHLSNRGSVFAAVAVGER